uniref:Uncharacterized protein n=1 Tax=Candidatus Kentrum sp. FW TaxID=2126338 RepID=A0A450TB61_9GAMM|nr:MAG: hypothetical protein BECKFW1821A_GA0114235_11614 [Candidatus Kentron sp. FW]VFJ70064.1 MAG: hypothetical protein BECKFW1821B_GA0114236_11784 [Candidatus Kentron sp. FW]
MHKFALIRGKLTYLYFIVGCGVGRLYTRSFH